MSTAPVNPGYYADFSGLTSLKRAVREDSPQAIRQVARQFESLLTHMLLKSMREAKLGDGLGDSQETEFYQDMFDQQLSLQLSQGKGLGLADMLVQQLTKSGLAGTKAAHGPAAAAPASVPSANPTSMTPAPAPTATSTPALGELPLAPVLPALAPHATLRPTASTFNSTKAVSMPEQAAFVRQLAPYAERAAQRLGVTPDALIAHAALETGWGRHVPAGEAGSSNNLFGIKATGRWNGGAVTTPTVEYSGGIASTLPQPFRAYPTLEQGINDYVNLLSTSPRFRAALGTGNDVHAFASGLARGGYATDPAYGPKLAATAEQVRALREVPPPARLAFAPAPAAGRIA